MISINSPRLNCLKTISVRQESTYPKTYSVYITVPFPNSPSRASWKQMIVKQISSCAYVVRNSFYKTVSQFRIIFCISRYISVMISPWTFDTKPLWNASILSVFHTCDPLWNGVQEETLEVIIEQLIRSRKDLAVCSVHCLSKTVGKVLDWYEKQEMKLRLL